MTNVVRYRKPEALLHIPTDNHAVIEASAGTGKTYTIEHLVIELLLTRDVGIENILVVTFTEKATAELTSRVRNKIRELLEMETQDKNAGGDLPDEEVWTLDDEARDRLRKALHNFDAAAISTIHSFCNGILTEHSFLNRRLFDQEPVEEQTVFSRAFMDVLRSEIAKNQDLQPYLTAWLEVKAQSVDKLEELLFKAFKARSPFHPSFDPEHIESTVTAFSKAAIKADKLEDLLRRAKVQGRTINPLKKHLAELQGVLERYSDGKDLTSLLAEMEEVKLGYIVDKLSLAEQRGAVAALYQAVAALKDALVPLSAAAAHLFLPVVTDRLNRLKRESGLYDFDDMLNLVAESLEGPHGQELIQTLRARYRYALIDEFQDTDEVQWRIFQKIFFESSKKNPLQVIGDPKQAIYAFRGADLQVYLQAQETIKKAGGPVVALDKNFRSTPPLLEACNAVFEQDETSPFFTGDIRYDHPVKAGRPDHRLIDEKGNEVPPVVLFQLQWKTDSIKVSEAREALAARIAHEIYRLTTQEAFRFGKKGEQETLTEKDIFVLTRSYREGNEIGNALRERGIAHVYYKQEGLFQTREAEQVRHLLAAVADPRDRSKRFRAWLTPFFGLSLSDLTACKDIPGDHPLLSRIVGWKALADAKEYEELFTGILEESGILRRELFLSDSERAITNYLHLFEILLAEVNRERCTLAELIRTLQGFIDERGLPVADQTNMQRLESERPAVRIMTMHMAKGLEAGVVFIYGGCSAPPSSPVQSYYVNGKRSAYVGKLSDAPADVKKAVDQEANEEDQRLLYVALTRAKARLYLPYFPEIEKTEKKGKATTTEVLKSGSYLQLNRRLRFLLEPELSTKHQELFQIEQIPCPAPAEIESEQKTESIVWQPPADLLQPIDKGDEFHALGERHQGFVITSYSRMKALRGGYRAPIDTGADILEESGVEAAVTEVENTLPGGMTSGLFLHEVLEKLVFETIEESSSLEDWTQNDDVQKLFRTTMNRNGIATRYLGHSQKLIYTTLTTPVQLGEKSIPSGFGGLTSNLREVEFIYPYPESPSSLWEEGGSGGPSGEGSSVPKPYKIERGYVKGFVDFVFEHQGLTYLADWKSDTLPIWTTDAINQHVEQNYRLQAQLYALALIKMLEIASPEEYESRFGGIVYCFLRGMKTEMNGIYFQRPTWDEIRSWEQELIGKTRL